MRDCKGTRKCETTVSAVTKGVVPAELQMVAPFTSYLEATKRQCVSETTMRR